MEKHILILTTTSDFLRKFERENVKILLEMGYVVHYAANMNEPHYLSEEKKIQEMGVQTHHIVIARSPFLFKENLKALRQLLWLIRKYDIQVLHCHTPVGGVLGRLAGRLCRDRKLVIIYTAHGFHFYKGAPLFNHLIYYRVERKLAHFTDILIVINEEDYRNARRLHLKKGGRVYKIPGVGFDRHLFHPLSEKEKKAFRSRLGIQDDEFFLVSVGELNDNKNHKIVLEALAKIRQTCKDFSKIKYGICGDGFFHDEMRKWIAQMGLKDTVTMYGFCPQVYEILGCADVSVFPSKREGLGMAGIESLAMGVPVIASDNRGTREYMEHGRNGFVCSSDDVDGFVRGIEAMRHLSAEKRTEMAVHCVDSVKPFDKVYANAVMHRIYADVDRRIGWDVYEKQSEDQYHYGGI